MRSLQKNAKFCILLHSFAKEHCILLQKNIAFFAFFYVLCKRMLRSLRYFMFFAKERYVLCILLCSLEKTQKNASFFWVS